MEKSLGAGAVALRLVRLFAKARKSRKSDIELTYGLREEICPDNPEMEYVSFLILLNVPLSVFQYLFRAWLDRQ